jgi:signal transduction histidine kinase
MAAWWAGPVEVPEAQPRFRSTLVDILLYLPFVGVGTLLIVAALDGRRPALAAILGFLAVTALVLVRQFLLLREVRRANERLEDRVAARTRALEDLQGLVLRTERLNAIGALGAGLAHDLNNALTVVRSYAELARMRVEEGHLPPPADLDRILVAADQSAALTGRLMAFARQKEESRETLDLAAEVASQEPLLRMMLNRRVALVLDLGTDRAPIHMSRSGLEQILVNLVGNAKDALAEGGTIEVRIRAEFDDASPRARLDVTDTGQGMTPDVQTRIFQPFFTTKPPGKGTGLGLSSVKHLVEGAEGSIEVESRPGLGTRFTLRFPLLA